MGLFLGLLPLFLEILILYCLSSRPTVKVININQHFYIMLHTFPRVLKLLMVWSLFSFWMVFSWFGSQLKKKKTTPQLSILFTSVRAKSTVTLLPTVRRFIIQAGGMAQWLRAHVAFAEDLSSVSSIHIEWLMSACNLGSNRFNTCGLLGHSEVHAYT